MQTSNSPVRTLALVAAMLLFCLDGLCHAGGMTKHLEAVSPRIGQRGTTVEVTLQGIEIQDPRQIIFFRPGIRATEIRVGENLKYPRGLAHGGRIVEQVICKFEIAPDCALGEHPFRLLTATQLTCIGTFHVSPFPVLDENEANYYLNDTPATAVNIPMNVTVRGVIASWGRGDLDLYRVPVKQGQHISVEVESARLADQHYGDSEYDLALRILDDEGKLIAGNDDNSLHVQDPMASCLAPRDGSVYIEVSRSVFMGRETQYCVHIGDHPRPVVAFPPGGPIGSSQAVAMLGDPSGTIASQITLPNEEGWYHYYGNAPSPIRMRASTYSNLLEDTNAAETRIETFPIAINGVIDHRDDFDTYRYSAKKGSPLHIRVFSASLGSPLDPRIRIRTIGPDGMPGPIDLESDDSRLEQRDTFGTSYRGGGGRQDALDPSIVWEPKTDGDYLLEIADNSGAGGPSGVYRIEIEAPRTIVQTALTSRTFDWTESMRVSGMIVPRNNRWTVNITLPQGQWNAPRCDFELVARGLPPGVTMTSPRIKPGTGTVPIQFAAAADAEPVGSVITLEALPVDPSVQIESRCQQTVPFINHSGGDAWRAVQVDKYIVAVTEPSPFSIDIEQPSVALVRGGELSIPVKITRHHGFSGPVEFSVGFVNGAIDVPPPMVIPADKDEGVVTLGAQLSAPIGVSPLVVIGSTIHETIDPFLGAGQIRVSSKIVELLVSEPYLELASQPSSIRRGERKSFVWRVNHKNPFEGEARVKLLGLPKGVTVMEPFPTVKGDSQEIAFEIQATDDALLGQVSGLSCEVIVPVRDQKITQRTGRGSIRIDPRL
ncbi:MAG: serine protease [Planctomycetes bacterium]|nr:serine protease [Planctomycetota bacterium]